MYFGKETCAGLTECSLVSSPVCPSPGALLCQAGLLCLPLDLSSGLPSDESGLAHGPLLAPSASWSLKELAQEAGFCAKPLESSSASVIKEDDATGKIGWEQWAPVRGWAL